MHPRLGGNFIHPFLQVTTDYSLGVSILRLDLSGR